MGRFRLFFSSFLLNFPSKFCLFCCFCALVVFAIWGKFWAIAGAPRKLKAGAPPRGRELGTGLKKRNWPQDPPGPQGARGPRVTGAPVAPGGPVGSPRPKSPGGPLGLLVPWEPQGPLGPPGPQGPLGPQGAPCKNNKKPAPVAPGAPGGQAWAPRWPQAPLFFVGFSQSRAHWALYWEKFFPVKLNLKNLKNKALGPLLVNFSQ